ncbi:M14 family metallopeptidase [Chromatiaceae bacterium AAb-1]|nr:M14 family metallopeptidase [Chromatiaceae bacterium AAb-1]
MKNASKNRLLTAIGSLLFSYTAYAGSVPYLPDAQYDQNIISAEQLLGYPLGSRISEASTIHHYFQQLAAAFPAQVKLRSYGNSWQGRPLFYVAISSTDNIAKLEQTEQNMQRLADPRQLDAQQADSLIKNTPASVWIAASLHGNEISPAEATMALAYHLLADKSELTQNILSNTVVYLDPLQNPDGHSRFVSRYYATAGLEHSADRFSAEQNEPWPNGRTNHYLFDMNRDWISLTQPENRGRVKVLQQTFPLIYVDSHEMGGDMSYYFSPEADPYNPFIQANQREALDWIGQNNASWFDQLGYHYFTREIFDAFYPGYGASWPLFHGSIATTYEMASARGHHYRRQDGTILTFADGVQRNFVAFMATLETASKQQETLLNRFYQYRKDAIAQGQKADIRSYIFPAQRDRAGHIKLTAILAEQGIEVKQATENFKACGNSYQAGAYIVNTAQPAYNLIRTLLDKNVPMDDKFLKEQERLRASNLPDQMYDVTAWSLPLMYNLEVDTCNRNVQVKADAVSTDRILPGILTAPDARYGYVVPWGDMAAARFMTALLRADLQFSSSTQPFTHQNGKTYPAGSLIISRADNNEQLTAVVTELVKQTGATVEGIDSSWVTAGPNFGSANVKKILPTNIAMLWDEPTNPLSAGSVRFVLERELNYPVTAIRPAQLQQADLTRYQVLVLPATGRGSYQQALGDSGREIIRNWVRQGGVLITLGNAGRFAISGKQPLLQSRLEYKVQPAELKKAPAETQVAGELINSDQEYSDKLLSADSQPDWVPGFLAKTMVDQNHWLTAGIAESLHTVYVGNDIYQPLTINDGRNVVSFTGPKDVVASGFVWQDNRDQIAHKPLVMVQPVGRGQIITFTQEPNYRAYVDGMHLLLTNAVFFGAAQAVPLR